MTVGDWGPGKNAFDDRVKRAGKRFVVAQTIMPVATVVAFAVAIFTEPADMREGCVSAAVVYALVVWALVAWARRQALRPGQWVEAASWSGGITGIFLGSAVLAAMGRSDQIGGNADRVLGLVVLMGCFLVSLFGARSLARQAKRTLLEPFDDALVRSAVELPWQARGDRKLNLTIGQDRVTLHGGFGAPRRLTKSHALTMITEARQEVDDHGGAAVRIVAAGEELLFPTDEPDKVLHALRERSRAMTA